MECAWKSHQLRVTGDWTLRYFYLAPTYTLWLDDQELDTKGGPKTSPKLEALVELEDQPPEDEDQDNAYHVEAKLVSLLGFRPSCELFVDGQKIETGHVKVQNFINPFLVLFILGCTSVMIYLGPAALKRLLP